jgi:hypothetical protein
LGNGARTPLESFSIIQKFAAEVAVPIIKLELVTYRHVKSEMDGLSYLELSNPRVHMLLFTGTPSSSLVPIHSVGVNPLAHDPISNGVISYYSSGQ